MDNAADDEVLAEFTQYTFNAEDFISSSSETRELTTILRCLNAWKSKNASKMSTVLKEQTDAVISIAEDVQTLYLKVESVNAPICQLREEIDSMDRTVGITVYLQSEKLEHNADLHKCKFQILCIRAYKIMLILAENLLRLFTCDDECQLNMQRLINLYIYHSENIAKMGLLVKDPPVQSLVADFITNMYLKGFEFQDMKLMETCMNCAVQLNLTDLIKHVTCDEIITPLLEPILSDEQLTILLANLTSLYEKALLVLSDDLAIFLGNEKLKFDFIVDCFWPVADRLMTQNLLSITRAVHPDIFFSYYSKTQAFLGKINNYTNDRLSDVKSYKEHMLRFSIYVYFEIRHQYCAHVFEETIINSDQSPDHLMCMDNPADRANVPELSLRVSVVLDKELKYIFDANVFIVDLTDQFIKLSMTLLRRYCRWIGSTFIQYNKTAFIANKYLYLYVLCDIGYFKGKAACESKNGMDLSTSPYNHPSLHFKDAVWDVLSYNFDMLHSAYLGVENKFITDVCQDVLEQIKNMFTIPRLYRRTNRSAPTSHSSYIDDALAPILIIHDYYDNTSLSATHICQSILDKIVITVCASYTEYIADLFSSINKTELSLRRLKNRNASASGGDEPNLNINSDEYKIRQQVTLDVQEFVEKLRPSFQGEPEDVLNNLLKEL